MKTRNIKIAGAQSGFTLIEIAVVLVIIGLLLGGVLQGQQLIENSRVKSATNDFNGIAAAAFSYQDRYGRLPGDDPGTGATANDLTGRGDSWADTTDGDGDGDGIIDSTLANVFTGADEVGDFFQHLRAAGFIQGDASLIDDQALPSNPFGGLTTVTALEANGMAGTKICMSNVGGSAGIALDTQLDDSDPDNGRLRATLGVAGANTVPDGDGTGNAAAYSEDEIYTLCYRI